MPNLDKGQWTERVEALLWERYGVQNIGIDQQLADGYAAGVSPWDMVAAIGKKFSLDELQTWKDRPKRQARRAE